MTRSDYIKEYKTLADSVLLEEKLPQASSLLSYLYENKTDSRLQHVFDFFDDEETLKEMVGHAKVRYSVDDTKEFIASVIAANITDISESGMIYKQLMATGDDYRIRGVDCGAKGRKISLPISEDDFVYEIKDRNIVVGDKKYKMFSNYEEFNTWATGKKEIFVRSPMTCKNQTSRSCCPICAGKVPENTRNIGAFSTLMITEVATQNALSSMNKGRKENVNQLLKRDGKTIDNIRDFHTWADDILEELRGSKVERRWYELALLGRMHYDKKTNEVVVRSLVSPRSDTNLFSNFMYSPNRRAFSEMVTAGSFYDDSLKVQIAENDYKKGVL